MRHEDQARRWTPMEVTEAWSGYRATPDEFVASAQYDYVMKRLDSCIDRGDALNGAVTAALEYLEAPIEGLCPRARAIVDRLKLAQENYRRI